MEDVEKYVYQEILKAFVSANCKEGEGLRAIELYVKVYIHLNPLQQEQYLTTLKHLCDEQYLFYDINQDKYTLTAKGYSKIYLDAQKELQ